MGTLANSEDPDEMQHNAAFHQCLHCLLLLKQLSGTEIHHILAWVKVFRINPEFRILRQTFHRKSAPKC